MSAVQVLCCVLLGAALSRAGGAPLVIATWFDTAVEAGYGRLVAGGSALDAVEAGCSHCEAAQCDGTVGYGGSPDEAGETTLDALIMDGSTMDVGAVGALRRVRDAISAARLVMETTQHTLLVGDQATAFSVEMGLPAEKTLSTNHSRALWQDWRAGRCQPNYRQRVVPDPSTSCGPYRRAMGAPGETGGDFVGPRPPVGPGNHDTIALVAIDAKGGIAAGTSTNGAKFKVPGRIGDSPIPGSGAYAVQGIGGCGSTGDGDIMMRFLPCYQVVESLRLGLSPKEAAEDAVARIRTHYPAFVGAVIAVDAQGRHAGACNNWRFRYAWQSAGMSNATVVDVLPRPTGQGHGRLRGRADSA